MTDPEHVSTMSSIIGWNERMWYLQFECGCFKRSFVFEESSKCDIECWLLLCCVLNECHGKLVELLTKIASKNYNSFVFVHFRQVYNNIFHLLYDQEVGLLKTTPKYIFDGLEKDIHVPQYVFSIQNTFIRFKIHK